jgi:division protein CdvB (Snf7/Vps24/ESCRT-III family)
MKKHKIKIIFLIFLTFPMQTTRADLFGADIPILLNILAQAINQLAQLQSILGTGKDTLGLLQDINQGIKDAMSIMRTMNSTMSPGVLSDLGRVEDILNTVNKLYGSVPQTSEANVQKLTDKSVAEAIQLHNQAFKYAESVDPEAERIKDYAKYVNPAGANKLTAQAIGVLINVMNQILRTNAAMLKVQSEQLALMNKKEKLSSTQFKMQYEGLSGKFNGLKNNYGLPSIR